MKFLDGFHNFFCRDLLGIQLKAEKVVEEGDEGIRMIALAVLLVHGNDVIFGRLVAFNRLLKLFVHVESVALGLFLGVQLSELDRCDLVEPLAFEKLSECFIGQLRVVNVCLIRVLLLRGVVNFLYYFFSKS